MFGNGLKFVILDEVDYMTKNAQQALRCLVQNYSPNIRFCLICNYISKIDKSLQNEFISMCFCNLPKNKIKEFLNNIIIKEKLNINNKDINNILIKFKSDMRSMINFLQSNRNNKIYLNNIVNEKSLKNIINIINENNKKNKKLKKMKNNIINYTEKNNISVKTYIVNLIKYIIQNNLYNNQKSLTVFEVIIHNKYVSEEVFLDFTLNQLYDLYKSV